MGVFKRPSKPKKGQHQYWWLRFQYQGKEYWESTHYRVGEITKDQARKLFIQRKQQVKNGLQKSPVPNTSIPDSSTLYEFSKEYVQQKKDEGKVTWQRDIQSLNNVMKFIDPDTEISEIDSKTISKYKSYRSKFVKPGTIDRELKTLRNLFFLAIDWKLYKDKNPVSVAKLLNSESKERRIITPEEQQLIMDASPVFFRDILMGAFNFGMRRDELANAQVSQVDMKNNFIYVPKSKSCNPRKIPLNQTMRKEMPRLIKEAYKGSLFKNKLARNYKSLTAITHLFKKICRSVDIHDVRFHFIRHTVTTRMFQGKIDENGNKRQANLPEVKYIIGHKDANTTMIYAHPDESIQEAVELLG